MKKNYYVELITDIEKLISTKKFDKALILINDELAMPYIPTDVEKKLNEFYKKIKFEIGSEASNIGIDKLLNLLVNKKISNEEKYDIVELMGDINLIKYFDEIANLLLQNNKSISFLIKGRIINQLKNQNISKVIKYKDKGDKEQQIDLSKIELLYDNKKFAKESMEIDKHLFKNPVASELAFILLENYFYSFFPNLAETDFEGIGFVCSLIALKVLNQKDEFEDLYNDSKIEVEKLQELINKLVSNIELK